MASEMGIAFKQVTATVELLDDGATVPFLARYRKEVTGGLDEVVIASIRDRMAQLRELDKRRAAILSSLEEQGKLTDELKGQIDAAFTMTELEDLYLPYRPKRRTRAMIAKERGLESLAQSLWAQDPQLDVIAEAGNPRCSGFFTKPGNFSILIRVWRPWMTHWPVRGISWPNGLTKISRLGHPCARCM